MNPFIQVVTDAEQYLICTEEIVIHLIDLNLISSAETDAKSKKIWQMHVENESTSKMTKERMTQLS